MSQNKAPGIKSAYELALDRLEQQGMKRPEDSRLTDEDRHRMADIRTRAEAKLAEVEILHRDRLAKSGDPMKRSEEEEHYLLERRRIEDERERQIEQIRRGKS